MAGWDIPDEDRSVLAEVGVPKMDPIFEPDLQSETVPTIVSETGRKLYRIGRCPDWRGGPPDLFGVAKRTGEVWCALTAPTETTVFVNSSVPLFVEFPHKVGRAWPKYGQLPDPQGIKPFERLVQRQRERDRAAFANEQNYWVERFDRWWG